MSSFERNASSRYCSIPNDVRPCVCPYGTGVHCDNTVHVSADLSLWLNSPMFWAPWHPKHVHLLPAVFFQFHLEQKWGMDVQTRPPDISTTVEDRCTEC